MSFIKRIILAAVLFCVISLPAIAASSFIVRRIRIYGLQRVSESTVYSYLPVHMGQRFSSQDSVQVIRTLYATGFFKNIRIGRRGNTLIVRVVERPTILSVNITGNHAIKTSKLKPILKKLGIVQGEVFNPSKLYAITQGLKQEYARLGRYAVSIKTQVKRESRNRVAIRVRIVEGPIATVRVLRIVGNHAFSEHTLLDQFKLTTPGLFSFITHDDRYSKDQLNKDLENLKNFYLNHGYLRFRVVSKQVTMTPDRKGVSIIIHVSEGFPYRLSGYRIKGHPEDVQKVAPMIILQRGAIFSRKAVIKINNAIAKYYADQGFAFPDINALPQINDKNHTVFLTYVIKPGRRVYVRHINIIGNNRTQDYVLRSQMRQLEASSFSLSKIKESKRRLANLPYLRNIKVTPVPVPGHPNEVDLNYQVTEVNAGRAQLQAGYSDTDGFLYGANITEPNFMGTGKYVGIGFQHSDYSSNYSFTYNNPFYTINGVSRGYNIYYTHTKPSSSLNYDTYTMDDFGGLLTYGFPISEFDTFSLSFGYDHIRITNLPATAPPTVVQFLQDNNSPYNQFSVTLGWGHSTLDRAIFPTDGSAQSLNVIFGVPVIKSSLDYYKATYHGRWYFPLDRSHHFIISPHALLGFGDGFGKTRALPFYYNYYAGGINTIPGYSANSMGPVNPANNNAIGGNAEIIGGINFIFPNPISKRVRTALIVDAGNVFQTHRVQFPAGFIPPGLTTAPGPVRYEKIALKNLRVTAGIMVSWYSPLGPLEFSLALPLNKKAGDRTTLIGFSFGTNV